MKLRRMKVAQTVLLTGLLLFFTSANLLAQNGPTDSEISIAVENELMFNATTPAYLIKSESQNGIVTLTGSVDNLLEKDRAVKIAKTVKGVRGVVDKIKVDAPDVSDITLQKKVDEALLNDPATDSNEIDVTVNNGVVNLEGTVESWQEKKLSEFVAKGVRGAKKVESNVGVVYRTIRPDYEIEEDIEGTLENDIRVDNALIDVEVNNGYVSLSGIVGSTSEQSLAIADAWVTGVKMVNGNELDIKQWARDENLRKDKYATRSDAEVKEAVEDAFVYDPRVYSFNPEIRVNAGVVTLTGEVSNLKAKRAAEQDAKNVVGVLGVNNHLIVVPEFIPEDTKLEADVTEAFKRDPIVEKWELDVNASNGMLYLNGTVDSYFEKAQAEDVASKVKGVIDVRNNLKVNDLNDVRYSDYYGWNTYYPPYHIDIEEAKKSDIQIEKDIQSQLWWSPYVNEDEVDVTVEDGTAILEGTVDTRREKLFAEINAIEGGAEDVENDLIVLYNTP
ncbi:BON domain-containing protein [Maribellus maritimus]|uniref:BON domain-containing protein n=1 Tax=Maribellus maritimus TaxID=2870838 RepID=UPI001EEB57A4|nr:BON domain-containing protein [Maribellus maritimus]MCG6187117.1 BON domain-containing protein [Maribellus maritimus]